MREEIVKMIEQHEHKGAFSYARVTDDMIQEAEKILGVKLPDQYVEFLKKYGQGGLSCLSETLGVDSNGRMMFVETTLKLREAVNLPENMVVIEYDYAYAIDDIDKLIDYLNEVEDDDLDEYGDYFMCMDCNTGKVYTWGFWCEPSINEDNEYENFENLEEFLIYQIEGYLNPDGYI